MKKYLTLILLLLNFLTLQTTQARTYIVNEDGTVEFLNRVAPNVDYEAMSYDYRLFEENILGRTYIVNEDGTVEFLDRVAPEREQTLSNLENIFGRTYIVNEDGTVEFLD